MLCSWLTAPRAQYTLNIAAPAHHHIVEPDAVACARTLARDEQVLVAVRPRHGADARDRVRIERLAARLVGAQGESPRATGPCHTRKSETRNQTQLRSRVRCGG